ncbi:M23 family metallopeptidase [Clostridium thermarum]|uniref:M23 family metallopeptidase n=1 Tax=Clostridium thermarum TaxID=1716543 RepID=UPI0013D2F130|nr:M23 family metallopeptidase [Clostridium thermarum]
MGSYNSHYQSYYASLMKNRRNNSYYRGTSTSKGSNPFDRTKLAKRILRELTLVFCLFLLVLACKTIKTPETTNVYNYCKEIVNYNFDYKAAIESLKDMDLQELSVKIQDYMEDVKSSITGEETIKEKINREFSSPLQGKVVSGYGTRIDPVTNNSTFHYGVDIDAAVGTEVKSCSDGVVKSIGEDEILGKYIVIDHGIGVETKYANLEEVTVENGAAVNSGEVIGFSGADPRTNIPQFHFELLYMGENKDPEEYIRLTYISE